MYVSFHVPALFWVPETFEIDVLQEYEIVTRLVNAVKEKITLTRQKRQRPFVDMLLLLQGKEVILGIEDPTADPSQWFYSNIMCP